jgi:hypothetical protein
MAVWLAPVPGTRFLVPVRANIETPMGSVGFAVTRWEPAREFAAADAR